MRTRDAATSIFHSAAARDARARVAVIDDKKIRDAVQRSLRRVVRDADEEHPGAHFVKAGVGFFHGDHPKTCGSAELSYNGPALSMADAGNVMTGLGYEMTGRTAVGAEYEHDDHEGKINLVAKAPSGAKDRRARDEAGDGSSGSASENSFMGGDSDSSSGSASDTSPLGSMSATSSGAGSNPADDSTNTNSGAGAGSTTTPTGT